MGKGQPLKESPERKVNISKARLRFFKGWLTNPDAGLDANQLSNSISQTRPRPFRPTPSTMTTLEIEPVSCPKKTYRGITGRLFVNELALIIRSFTTKSPYF
jgi:hypothetical protein